jgi:putative spermidine/putrescine transport system permease protein
MADLSIGIEELQSAKKEVNRKKLVAFLFVAPLLVFVFLSFVMPIASMLTRSAYSPEVAQLLPQTLVQLDDWDGAAPPNEATQRVFAAELAGLHKQRLAGRLAGDLNKSRPGASSVVQSTARRLVRVDLDAQPSITELMLSINPQWSDLDMWRAIKRAGTVFKVDNYLTALDLESGLDGSIQQRENAQIYIQLYTKTLLTALIITLMTIVLGYPLSYYLANAPTQRANMLMVFVLLPFWTSLLVRTTSWIAILQTNGVMNSTLMYLGFINEPLELLYTQSATVIAMTHILLPFMVLPLYSVMKGIDPSYMRAAQSMGAKPLGAFAKIYLPMTLPGLGAGVLLVFIISIGYYITPALVGGTDGQMISNIIAFHMQQSNNWELAAALGSLLLALILVLYWVYDKFVGVANIKLG